MNVFEGFLDELRKIAAEDDVDQTATERPEPDGSEVRAPENDTIPVGDLASTDARETFQGLLKTPDGRYQIRDAYGTLRSKIDDVVGARKAFTRSLLRARREVFGPSGNPRSDLKRILYGDDSFVNVTPAE